MDKISCRITYCRSYTRHPASVPYQRFDTQTISVPSRLKDVSLGMQLSRKSDAPLCPSCEYTRTQHWSIIIGRSAKPKSVHESSLYSALPQCRHFLWRTETRALGEGGWGRLRANVNYYWQFHETNSLLVLSSVHTRHDAARRGATDSIRHLIAFGLVGFDKRMGRPETLIKALVWSHLKARSSIWFSLFKSHNLNFFED